MAPFFISNNQVVHFFISKLAPKSDYHCYTTGKHRPDFDSKLAPDIIDKYNTEVILLQKDLGDGSITVVDTPMNSFGASPLEIMRTIFDAPESVGQRAAEFLDLVLMVASYPTEVRAVWSQDTRTTTLQELQELPEFARLREVIKIPSYMYRDEDQLEQLNTRLARVLRSLHRYTQRITGRTDITMTDALDALQERIGPGYYQFEFRRRLVALRRDSNAAPN